MKFEDAVKETGYAEFNKEHSTAFGFIFQGRAYVYWGEGSFGNYPPHCVSGELWSPLKFHSAYQEDPLTTCIKGEQMIKNAQPSLEEEEPSCTVLFKHCSGEHSQFHVLNTPEEVQEGIVDCLSSKDYVGVELPKVGGAHLFIPTEYLKDCVVTFLPEKG